MSNYMRLGFIWGLVFFAVLAGCKKDQLRVQQVVYTLQSNTTDRLDKIRFVGDKDCFVSGGEMFDRATVLHSTDGGVTWTASSHPDAGKAMFGMGVSPQGGLFMCGVDGTVLHTSDTGKSWKVGRILNWQHYVAVDYVTADTGVFISTILQRGGSIVQVDAAFNIIQEDSVKFGLNNVYMVSPKVGYVVGYGAVLKTSDYRKTWLFQDVHGDNFTAMDVHGEEIWMCGSNGGIYHTSNGGDKWECLRNGNSLALPRYMLRDILFTDADHGWAVGDDGLLIRTEDGGHNWMEYEHFTKHALRDIAKCPNGDLLIAGDAGSLYRVVP